MKDHKTKLLQAIEVKLTGQLKPLPLTYTSIDFSSSAVDHAYRYAYGEEYYVGVRMYSTTIIDAGLPHKEKEIQLSQAQRVIGRGIANEIYGDIRSKLIDLSVQLYKEGRFESAANAMVNDLIDMVTYE